MTSLDWQVWLVRGVWLLIAALGVWAFWSRGLKDPLELPLGAIFLMLVFILDELRAIRHTLRDEAQTIRRTLYKG